MGAQRGRGGGGGERVRGGERGGGGGILVRAVRKVLKGEISSTSISCPSQSWL